MEFVVENIKSEAKKVFLVVDGDGVNLIMKGLDGEADQYITGISKKGMIMRYKIDESSDLELFLDDDGRVKTEDMD